MPADIHEDFSTFGGKTRAQSVYQPSSGEKHVLFYPTSSPVPSAGSDEPRSWSQGSSCAANNTTNATLHVSDPKDLLALIREPARTCVSS